MPLPLLATLLLAIAGLAIYLRIAPRWGLIDSPNERSLHQRPTIVGGGLPVMLAAVAGWLLLPGDVAGGDYWVGAAVATLTVIGLLDDRYGLPSGPRLIVYLCTVAVVLWRIDSPATLTLLALGLVAWLWFVNLFNFMDGADGFAGLQAVLSSLAMGLLCWFGPAPELAGIWWVLVASLLPFLALNWPPARCFMGDAGSIPLGFMLGYGGLMSGLADLRLGAAWLIVMMPFLVDATVTLIIRLKQGYSPFDPHRDHAYQRAVRTAGTPLPVLLGLAALHLLWQFPLAMTVVQTALFIPILVIISAIPSAMLLAYFRRAA